MKTADGIEVFCSHSKIVLTEELRPHPKNVNRHPEPQIELLAKIIVAQGWRNPVVVSKRSGYIIKGHGRLEAARLARLTEIPVDFQDYDSDEAEIEDMLADNRIAELADLDKEATAVLLKSLEAAGRNLDLAGFDEKAVAAFFKESAETEKPEVAFTEELLESHNYVVLYTDNEIDWTQLQTLYPLPSVDALDSKPGFEKRGIGRVIRAVDFINALLSRK